QDYTGNGASFTFKANDGALNSNEATVTVSVSAVNDSPTLTTIISPFPILEDAAQQTVSLTGIGAGGGESQTLTVIATSNDSSIVPDPTVVYTSANATGTLCYTPVANAFGTATIT